MGERGVQPRDLKASVELVSVALKSAVSDQRGRWVLGPHPEATSEHRIRARLRGGTRSYVIDRLFRTTEGVRWIVDYKTSHHEGSGLDSFLDRERERYASQLSVYAELIPQSRQGLYFAVLKGWRELP